MGWTGEIFRVPVFFLSPPPPPPEGGVDLSSINRGCARLGSEVAPPLGVLIEEVAVLAVLVSRHCRAVRAVVRRAMDGKAPAVVEKDTGLLDALPVNALGARGIVVVVRDVGPRQVVGGDAADAAHVPRHFRERAHQPAPPLCLLSAVAIGQSEPVKFTLS